MTNKRRLTRLGLGVVVAGALIQLLLGSYYLAMAHSPRPHHVPVGIVASPQQIATIAPPLEADGSFVVETYVDSAALTDAITHRRAYGGVVIDAHGPRLYVASAAGPTVSRLLTSLYDQQHAAQQSKKVDELRRAGKAVDVTTVAALTAPPTIVDLVPLPEADSGGSSLGFLIQALSLGASIASLVLGRLGRRVARSAKRGIAHAGVLIAYAVASGLVAMWAMAIFGVGAGADHGGLFLAFSLVSLAITASTAGAVALVGPAGAVLGAAYFTLGVIISGSSIAPELLPRVGGVIGQVLPPGAGSTFVRDSIYFPNASHPGATWVLSVFAVVGLAVVIVRNALAGRSAPSAE